MIEKNALGVRNFSLLIPTNIRERGSCILHMMVSYRIRRNSPYLGQKEDDDNDKYEWRFATRQPGKWLGMEYVKHGSKKRFLNVELLQASMDAPRQYATYDCKKIN